MGVGSIPISCPEDLSVTSIVEMSAASPLPPLPQILEDGSTRIGEITFTQILEDIKGAGESLLSVEEDYNMESDEDVDDLESEQIKLYRRC